MSENEKRDLEIKAYYLAGGNRKSAMERWKIRTGQLAGISPRLNMYWKRSLENRRNGNDSAAPILETLSDASLYQAGSIPRRYGRPLSVLTRERRKRGLQDDDFNIGGAHSPYPEPTKDCPFETIAYIAREMYEKPFKKTSEI